MPPKNRHSRRRQLQASHQKNWLTGRYAVLEVLRAGVWPVVELFLGDPDNSGGDECLHLAEATQTRVTRVTSERLTQLCDSRHHQGYAARMDAFPYRTLEDLLSMTSLSNPAESVQPPVLVVCDCIQDSFNFGAILRCCDAMNVAGVVIGDRGQTGITPQVARSSAGAVNHIPVALTTDLVGAVHGLQNAGFVVGAASEKSTVAAWDCSLNGPTALIIGNEARGVADELLTIADCQLRIPMLGQVTSLNAAVAAGILLYEIRRQQAGV